MLNNYESNVTVTIAFLKFFKVSVNNAAVGEVMQNRPDRPCLICSLNKWNVPNTAENHEFKSPFRRKWHSVYLLSWKLLHFCNDYSKSNEINALVKGVRKPKYTDLLMSLRNKNDLVCT